MNPINLQKFNPLDLKNGNRRLLLLLHGFGVSPQLFADFADKLHSQGFDIYAPHLTGDIGSRESFAESGRVQWLKRTFEAYKIKSAEYGAKNISVVGFSMGGLLALGLAWEKELEKVVLLSPFMGFHPLFDKTICGVIKTVGFFSSFTMPNWSPDCTKPGADDVYCYGVSPLPAVKELVTLKQEVIKMMGSGKKIPPTLCLHGRKDRVANFKMSEKIMKLHPDINFRAMEKSRHYILHDIEKETVYNKIIEFLA
jgi:carboxylesterase